MTIDGILISSGFSKRMGKLKPLLDYNGIPFVLSILIKMSLVCKKVYVVLGHDSGKIQNVLNSYLNDCSALPEQITKEFGSDYISNLSSKVEYVLNPEYKLGMFTSLKCGIRKTISSNWVLYHFVDQPGLPTSFYKEFVKDLDENYNWVQPKFNDRKGHPLLLGKPLFTKILSFSNQSSLREVSSLPLVKKKYLECNYLEILQDIDTPKDYKKLQ